MIGQIAGEKNARTLSDYLLAQGIDSVVEADRGDSWVLWIRAEEHLAQAKGIFDDFARNPADPKYSAARSAADEVREARRKDQQAYEKRVKARRNLFVNLTPYSFGPLTFGIILFTVAVYIYQLTHSQEAVDALYISHIPGNAADFTGIFWGILHTPFSWKSFLPEVQHGEIWRLITPIFMHASPLHIFFNMWWMVDLGSMIESRQGSSRLMTLVLAFAAVSNVAQYFMAGPMFLGMSGVVYGLLGYIWIRGKLDPASGLFLHKSTVTISLIWLVFCFFSTQPVANSCHVAGLLGGVAWGFLSSLGK